MIMSTTTHRILRCASRQFSCSINKACRQHKLMRSVVPAVILATAVSSACAATDQQSFSVLSTSGNTLEVTSLGEYDQPWAMSFLPDGELLITEKNGRLWMVRPSTSAKGSTMATVSAGEITRFPVSGVPDVQGSGQGGLGDVVVHPDYANNGFIYLSYVEREGSLSGAAVVRAQLDLSDPENPRLTSLQDIWRQEPKVSGEGHYGYRLAFSADGYLFITSGERQKFDPAQDMQMNLGKLIRLLEDGTVPTDNPWADQGGIAAQFWSIGHRNPLGIAFAEDGELWVHEMGPRGGDELNRIEAGANYGYPVVSNGTHYSGQPIPDHDTRPEFQAPELSWTPVISPSSFVIYDGDRYTDWQGSGLIGGLSSQALVRVSLDETVSEIERFNMNRRIREVEQDGAGVVYLLEDRSGGRLLRLAMP